jgi:hypothetical protein
MENSYETYRKRDLHNIYYNLFRIEKGAILH